MTTGDQRKGHTGRLITSALAIALLGFGFFLFSQPRNERDRFRADYAAELPQAAREVAAEGNAAIRLYSWLELDRGVSTVLVMPRSDLAAFRGQFDLTPFEDQGDPFLRNIVATLPGLSAHPEEVLVDVKPQNGSDVLIVWVFSHGDDEVTVWLHSDWS